MVVFATTLVQAVRHPRRSTVDPALLFGASLLLIATSVGERLVPSHAELMADLSGSASMLLPYLLLRLAEDFAQVPRWLLRVAEMALVLSIAILFVVERRPPWLTALLLSYFIVASLFATAAFVREAGRS
ncbi:MAG TPA: hypothetical protein VK009_19015, partial [Chloroflexota bacterium]|nr:hypothetical protein [Chloroflexota bacterium]